ncbi:hypothetical protein AAFF_G00060740 [Aldrovandia affinis]|uniref:Uncharacterized protein n=1 Tax=Aldrovandia affinis TaxID=143900 RepID=A0AAD7S049_9TELE|nr:hypothetical protein AAFF_G00060740 [Aldrovandia affinis]
MQGAYFWWPGCHGNDKLRTGSLDDNGTEDSAACTVSQWCPLLGGQSAWLWALGWAGLKRCPPPVSRMTLLEVVLWPPRADAVVMSWERRPSHFRVPPPDH